jgi:DNA-binding Lrp family transcriptional regulator
MRKVLEILEQDARLPASEIGARLGIPEGEVAATIASAEQDGALLGYSAVVNWERTDDSEAKVYAMISVSATPEHGKGFDAIAEHVALFDEVHSVYLMSGGFDLHVVVEGDDFREIARFVAEKLAPIPGVTGTSTAFVLKTYKTEGRVTHDTRATKRLAVSP